MPEWSNGLHSKCGVRATVPGVRIPLFPRRAVIFTALLFLFIRLVKLHGEGTVSMKKREFWKTLFFVFLELRCEVEFDIWELLLRQSQSVARIGEENIAVVFVFRHIGVLATLEVG